MPLTQVGGRTLAARAAVGQEGTLTRASWHFDGVDGAANEHWSSQQYVVTDATRHPQRQRLRRDAGPGPYTPIRVRFELLPGLPEALRVRLATEVVPWVKQRLAESVSVVAVAGNLSLTAPSAGPVWCGQQSAVVPEWHLSRSGLGVPSIDTIVYVAGVSCGTSADVLAFSATCFRDQHDRPIAGLVNLCERAHDVDAIDVDTMRTLLLHETLHVLGFSQASYRYYRDCAGGSVDSSGDFVCSPRVPRDASGQPVVGTSGGVPGVVRVADGVQYVHSPGVVAAARQYFGCATLTEVPLEDEGSGASTGQHWEARVLAYDVMNSVITVGLGSRYFVSDVTLALLNDSGWYQTAQPSAVTTETEAGQWGRGEGCDFLQCTSVSPTEAPTAPASPPTCSCSGSTFCDTDGSYVAPQCFVLFASFFRVRVHAHAQLPARLLAVSDTSTLGVSHPSVFVSHLRNTPRTGHTALRKCSAYFS
jgi:hypothetical protein